MVLPVRGGATISPRCPLPIGEIRSMTRGVLSFLSGSKGNSIVNFESGYKGVKLSKLIRWRTESGFSKLIDSTFNKAK